MTAKDVIKQVVEFCHMVVGHYLDDLKDEDLMVRAVPGSNHLAWQLGHLISGDCHMLATLGHTPPALPEGFEAQHTKETASSDDASKFCAKQTYVELAGQTKAAVLAALAATPEADLEKAAPESMRAYAATVSAALTMLGTHWLMHAGQFVMIRRKLGRPPLF